jgi:protein TonB
MFDYVVHKPTEEPGKPRYMTATVSAVAHVVALMLAVGLPILYASDELPEPPDMMAFVVSSVPPPPPPPPPPAPKPPVQRKAVEAAKPNQPTVQVQKPIEAKANPVAAPVEAPSAIKPETGLENAGAAATGAASVQAGFEGGIAGGVVGGAIGGVESAAPPPPPPAPKPTGPVRVGGNIKAPALAHRVNPVYPPVAQSAQIEGSVVLEATVDKSGGVRAVRVVRGHSILDDAAIAAVKQWRYQPLMLNGEPMEFVLTVTVNFSIPR